MRRGLRRRRGVRQSSLVEEGSRVGCRRQEVREATGGVRGEVLRSLTDTCEGTRSSRRLLTPASMHELSFEGLFTWPVNGPWVFWIADWDRGSCSPTPASADLGPAVDPRSVWTKQTRTPRETETVALGKSEVTRARAAKVPKTSRCGRRVPGASGTAIQRRD